MGAAHGRSFRGMKRSEAEDLLYREARALDERRFDDWLAMYAEDVVFWDTSVEGRDDDDQRSGQRAFAHLL